MNARRYPRSMAEAFGPYTDNRLYPMPERRRGNGRIRSVLLAVVLNSMCSTTVYAAARELSQRVEAAMEPAIKARAAELMNAQDKLQKRLAEEVLS